MKYKILFIIVALLIFSSCAHEASQRYAVLTIERSGCMGACPVYNAVIYSNGEVEYEGKYFVKVKGIKKYQIEKSLVVTVSNKFSESGYFSMKDEYRYKEQEINGVKVISGATDLPTTVTSLNLPNRYKKVVNYYGAPEVLNNLEYELEKISGIDKLIH